MELNSNRVYVRAKDEVVAKYVGHAKPEIVSDSSAPSLARQLALHSNVNGDRDIFCVWKLVNCNFFMYCYSLHHWWPNHCVRKTPVRMRPIGWKDCARLNT